MNKYDEFLKAYADYPSQDNEGFCPDRGSFKAGFMAAWERQQQEVDVLKLKLASQVKQIDADWPDWRGYAECETPELLGEKLNAWENEILKLKSMLRECHEQVPELEDTVPGLKETLNEK